MRGDGRGIAWTAGFTGRSRLRRAYWVIRTMRYSASGSGRATSAAMDCSRRYHPAPANHFFPRLAAAIILLVVSTSPLHADSVDGAWSDVHDWPLIAIHAALTPDGRVLTYGTDGTGKQTGYFIYDIWDPAAGLQSGHMTLDNMTLTDIFCSSQIILPQSGEILIAGGDNWTGTRTTNTGNNNSNLFDFGDNSLARSANMNRARWYSSSTALVNGDIYIQGGSGGGDRPEVRQADGTFRLLTGAATNPYATLFPRNFLAPDGRVFGYDSNARMYFVDTDGAGSLSPVGQFASSYVGWTSGAAMFAPGRILQMGGNSNGAVVVDITGPEPVVTPTSSLSSRRAWVSATVLADGQVLATGGSEADNQLNGVNNFAEIWNPDTGQWHVGAEAALARLYHSSALLLPDGTVLVAGGGAPGPLVNTNAEIYYPPYLFAADGSLAPRPEIISAPFTANVGDSLSIQVAASAISRVTLVKSGSVTHSVNMDQRFIELPFTMSANMLDVTLPVRASDTPPGYYMLYVFDDSGVPSTANILKINVDPAPNVAVDYTPAMGGGGGAPFQLSCASDEILVGVHGVANTYVNQVGPQCVQMDQFGRWIGDPVDGPVTGATTSGSAFSRTCPRDSAMSGFRGRADQYVNQLEIECRALTSSGGLSGAGVFMGADGSGGGNAQALQRCGTDNPGHALYGRSGGWLDSFGLMCQQGAITMISVNSTPVVNSPGQQSGIVGTSVDLQIEASDGDDDPLTYGASGLPGGLSIDPGAGRITGIPNAAGTFGVTVTVSDGTETVSAVFDWTIDPAPPLSVETVVPHAPQTAGSPITFTAVASGGVNVVYSWDFGDGSPATGFSASADVTHTFSDPGIYYVTLTVDEDYGGPDIQTFVQGIRYPLTPDAPAASTNILVETDTGSRIWAVNQDNDSVSVFDAAGLLRIAEIDVGIAPRSIAVAPDGSIWVTNKHSADISVIDPAGLAVTGTIALPHHSQPYGLVFSPTENAAFAVLEATGQLLRIDAQSHSVTASVATGPNPRHLAIDSQGATIYVSRFITPPQPGEHSATVSPDIGGVPAGGEVLVIDAAAMSVVDTIVLQHSDLPDAENQGRGVPNYLGAPAISPDGLTARVPSKQDNIARGELRDPAFNLNFQNTVRAISSRIELTTRTEDYARRIDYDNTSLTSATIFEPNGIYAFAALETSREVAVVDAYAFVELFRFDVGRAPQGLAVSQDGLRLYVSNFMDRTVSAFDLTELQTRGQWNIPLIATMQSVAVDKLPGDVLLGKQLFYDARDTRLARDGYLSCASCHNDGGHDGRTWDLTGFGEGLRNTISLRGTGAAHGKLHWSENFDEVQDFEGQIRSLSEGTGLMADADFFAGTRSEPLGDAKAGLSVDLDALAAYVESLGDYPDSPYRNADGSLTAAGEAGRQVFRRENCAACHSGSAFTDSSLDRLHDVGTMTSASGSRLGGPLVGIDTPTLRGLASGAPFLHDGSAMTIADAVNAHHEGSLDEGELSSLVAYLEQIDRHEITAPVPNVVPTIANPGSQLSLTGDTVNLLIVADDPDGGVLGYSASGLPPGLTISVIAGVISGTPDEAGEFDVTVSIDDGEDSASVSFTWSVGNPNTAPAIANPGEQTHVRGSSVTLALEGSDADGDTLTYSATGLPPGLSIDVDSGVISGVAGTIGGFDVTTTVFDGEDTASMTFHWRISEPVAPPSSTSAGGGGAAGPLFLMSLLILMIGRIAARPMAGRSTAVILLSFYVVLTPSQPTNAAELPTYERVRVLTVPKPVELTNLIDQDGHPFDAETLRGQVTLVFFGFTHCPDVCPLALEKFSQLERRQGEELDELAYVMVSVDGDRDDPTTLKEFLSRFSENFVGLTGDTASVTAIARQFSASFFKEQSGHDGHYDVAHSPQIFVVDPEGRLRAEFYFASVDAMVGVSRALQAEAVASPGE